MTKLFYKSLLALSLISLWMVSPLKAASPDDVVGIWLTEGGQAKIQIYKSGDKYVGKLIWAENPYDANGKPKLDKKNPNEKLRSKPLIGLVLMTGFEYDEDNEWDDGQIYDPESGNSYSGILTLEDKNTLNVRGYLGFSFIGRSQNWKRVG